MVDSMAPEPAVSSSVGTGKAGVGMLVAVALGAAGLGFAVFAYVVPYRKAARDLKMARGELMGAKAEAAGRERELSSLRGELSHAQQAAGDVMANVRSQTHALRLALQEQSKSAPPGSVELQLEPRGLQVRLADSYLFADGGAQLSDTGVVALRALGRSIGNGASRVIITAPMGKTTVPAELAAKFASSQALGAERVRAVHKILAQSVVAVGVLWGVSTGGPAGDRAAVVDLEITPSN